jgi:hypothetical protein
MTIQDQLNIISDVRETLSKVKIVKNDTQSVLNALGLLKNDANKDYVYDHIMCNFLRYKDQSTVDYVTLQSLDLGYNPKRQLYCSVVIMSKEEKQKRNKQLSDAFKAIDMAQLMTDQALPKGY